MRNSGKTPTEEQLRIIAEADVASLSGMNRQLWRMIIVKNKELFTDLEAEGIRNLSAMPDKSMYERIMSLGGKL